MSDTNPEVTPENTIALACDHGGIDLKLELIKDLEAQNLKVIDLGTHTTDSVDYPDYAHALAATLQEGKALKGVLICGTGIGISIAANRHPEVRAANIHDAFGAKLCRQHNDANVICFGARTIGVEVARDCLSIFLETGFEGDRHVNRINKITPS